MSRLSEHINAYNVMLSHLNVISEQVGYGTVNLAQWKFFLSDWLLSHIANTDKALVEFVEMYRD